MFLSSYKDTRSSHSFLDLPSRGLHRCQAKECMFMLSMYYKILRAITSVGAKFFPFCTSKTYFFYFTHLFLQNTHISLSIIHVYSNKIFISLAQSTQPPSLSRSTPSTSHCATRSAPESTQANHTGIPKKTSKIK